jgi:hypothetical protein
LENYKMTIDKDFKALVRARMAQTGENYTTAKRALEHQAPPARSTQAAPAPRDNPAPMAPSDVLAILRAVPFAVAVRPFIPHAVSATFAVAKQAAAMAGVEGYIAESGAAAIGVTADIGRTLIAVGAADARRVQVIRTFHNEHGVEFSERCAKCRSWIFCGTEEREGHCLCGHAYRVVFDLAKLLWWKQKRDRVCVDCGTAFGFREWRGPRLAWDQLNEWQQRCGACTTGEHKCGASGMVPMGMGGGVGLPMRVQCDRQDGHMGGCTFDGVPFIG